MKTHFFIDRTTGILCLDQHELAALITWDEAGKPYSDVEEAPLLRRYGRVARPDFPHCLAAGDPAGTPDGKSDRRTDLFRAWEVTTGVPDVHAHPRTSRDWK